MMHMGDVLTEQDVVESVNHRRDRGFDSDSELSADSC